MPIPQNTDILVSLQQLINTRHAEEIVDDAKCENVQCKNITCKVLACNAFVYLPDTIVFVLQRFKQNSVTNRIDINDWPIHLNSILEIPLYNILNNSASNVSYKLCSFVSHYDKTINSGHYIAGVVEELSEGFSIVQCNDTTIALHKPTKSIINDGNNKLNIYIVLYERVQIIDTNLIPILKILNCSLGVPCLKNNVLSDTINTTMVRKLSIIRRLISGEINTKLLLVIRCIINYQVNDFHSIECLFNDLLQYIICKEEHWSNSFAVPVGFFWHLIYQQCL